MSGGEKKKRKNHLCKKVLVCLQHSLLKLQDNNNNKKYVKLHNLTTDSYIGFEGLYQWCYALFSFLILLELLMSMNVCVPSVHGV